MPNYVYHNITFNTTLSSKQKKILKEIEKADRGICGYYMPMPKDLTDTSSPTRIVSKDEYDAIMKRIEIEKPMFASKPLTKPMSEELKLNHGHNNWYDWAVDDSNWGTKWGCQETDVDGHSLHCQTAWGPFSNAVFNMLINDFPDLEWHWEEEQGYGATIVVEDGVVIASDEYDPIPWAEVGRYKANEDDQLEFSICYTFGRPETMNTEAVQPGFYIDYSEHEYLGDTIPMDIYNKLSEEQKEKVLKYYHRAI